MNWWYPKDQKYPKLTANSALQYLTHPNTYPKLPAYPPSAMSITIFLHGCLPGFSFRELWCTLHCQFLEFEARSACAAKCKIQRFISRIFARLEAWRVNCRQYRCLGWYCTSRVGAYEQCLLYYKGLVAVTRVRTGGSGNTLRYVSYVWADGPMTSKEPESLQAGFLSTVYTTYDGTALDASDKYRHLTKKIMWMKANSHRNSQTITELCRFSVSACRLQFMQSIRDPTKCAPPPCWLKMEWLY